MTKKTMDDIEAVLWLLGITLFTAGSGLIWGWPASLLALGAILTFWPMVKAFVR